MLTSANKTSGKIPILRRSRHRFLIRFLHPLVLMSRVPSLQKTTQRGSNNSRRNTYLCCNCILHINKGASTNRLEITFGESVYGPLIYYIMDTEDRYIEHSKDAKA